jgi:glycosyltransferase involved in cell wall biosynthesis
MGGAMTFYRHFVERSDFEIKVITNCDCIPPTVPYQPLMFGPNPLVRRLFRTRLMPWLYGPHSLMARGRISRSVWQAARQFNPDLVFTVAGSWDYSALVAQQVARRLNVPLAASFNDWYNYGWFPSHPVYHSMIEKRFRRLYFEADLALCTCEGMKESLGPHRNAHILYPIGTALPETKEEFKPYRRDGRPFIVAFAGNLGEWYRPMLDRLIETAKIKKAPIEFRFYGRNPSAGSDCEPNADGVYRGLLPFEQLKLVLAEANALIIPMGFEERASLIERTSFKTKFLDYLSYQKPILVWGPEYCSAVRVAREFDSAEICEERGAAAFLETILAVRDSPERQAELVKNGRKMYEDRFHPDKIHGDFVRKVQETVEKANRDRAVSNTCKQWLEPAS